MTDEVLRRLAEPGAPARASATLAEEVRRSGMALGRGTEAVPLAVDPVPRVVGAAAWAALEAGAAQRCRALDRFVADAHGARECVAAGVVPAAVVDGSRYLERDLVGLETAVRIGQGGPDVVWRPGAGWVVLEDNVRTPTMLAFAVGVRRCVARLWPDLAPSADALAADARGMVLGALRAAAPDLGDPHLVVLADRGVSAAPWELDAFGPLLGLPVLELDELVHRAGALVERSTGRRVDVVLRRTSEERLRTDTGALTPLGEAFLEPLRAGTVAVVNAFGTGVADDKRVLAHVGDLIRFFLGEEPLMPSVPERDPRDPWVLEHLGELVAKPRGGSGGRGVLIGPAASQAELARTRAALRAEPDEWIVQELVRFSAHPTCVDGALEERHADLRPYVAVHDGGARVLRGAFSRFAPVAGGLVVNCSRGGGAKDVWL